MYSNAITQVLEKEHKNEPTLIQERTYDAIRNGASIVGLAKTGTGKTLAYGLPVMVVEALFLKQPLNLRSKPEIIFYFMQNH